MNLKKLLVCIFSILFVTNGVFAASIDDLKSQIQAKNDSIKQIEQEIAQYQSQLNAVGKQKNSLQNTLKELDLTQKKLSASLKLTTSRIAQTTLTIEQLDQNINQKEHQIGNNLSNVGQILREIDERDQISLPEIILAQKTTSEAWNQVEQYIQLRDSTRAHVVDLRQLQAELKDQRRQVDEKRKELIILKQDLSDQKILITANQKNKQALLIETKNTEANYQKILAQKTAQRDAYEQELTAFESQLKFALDPSQLPPIGRGVLKWPLDNVYITQYFGQTEFAKSSAAPYAGKGHNGIDFRASIGTPVKSAGVGIVTGTGNTDLVCPRASYGKWILIKHDNGLSTLYGHLSIIRVLAGQSVGAGETIALSGESGYALGPHLHFTVYASQGVQISNYKSRICAGTYTMPISPLNTYLNPLIYL